MLIQIFAPYPDSVNDRVLFFFACSRVACQKKDGSVRAFRCLSRNEKWAKKLERLKQKDQEKKKKQIEEEEKAKEEAKSNPFTVCLAFLNTTLHTNTKQSHKPNPFNQSKQGGGAFGADSSDSEQEEQPRFKKIIVSDSEEDESDEDSELEAELAKLEIVDGGVAPTKQSWPTQPSYSSHYVATTPEVIPKQSNEKPMEIEEVNQTLSAGPNNELEEFEKSMGNGMDEAFEHFIKCVSHEPQQCIRYDLGGMPLMYTNRDGVYKELFRGGNHYDASKVPRCEQCGSKRVFECQVTPNIINLCNNSTQSTASAAQSDDERKKELQDTLENKSAGSGKADMEWGTILLYVCENDCCLDPATKDKSKEGREQWIEELTYIQWE